MAPLFIMIGHGRLPISGEGMAANYEYKLAVFEGPLDLLLHLIEKHKIDIYDIPIVEITSQYMEQLDSWNRFDISYSSEFLVMAATLLQIKSRMLLPKAAPAEDAEEEDPRDELVNCLLEYKQIKELTSAIEARSQAGELLFPRVEALSQWGRERVYRFELAELYRIFKGSLLRDHKADVLAPVVQVERESVSLEETLQVLIKRMKGERRLSFRALLCQADSREKKVVLFIAVLELLKRQVFSVVENDSTDAVTSPDVILIAGQAEGDDVNDTIGY